MEKITPFLWFDNNAEEAATLYASIFENSRVEGSSRMEETGPERKDTVVIVNFQLAGLEFSALNGGPMFKFSPAVSFFVSCETPQQLDKLWAALSEGGMVLMELGQYPFSEKFGWLVDRFGVSWQLNLTKAKQKITPFLMFVGAQHGKAEEAIKFYTATFKQSSILKIERFGKGEGETEGTVKHATFSLNGQEFMAMESGLDHHFTFTPAISFFVNCETQAQVDELWDNLSAGGEVEQCGWLKDKYGVSWQIVPSILGTLLQDKDPVKAKRVMDAMLNMVKLDIAGLQRAYDGK